MKRQKLFTRHGGRFIKPDDCGSTVAWIVDLEGRGPNEKAKHEYDRKPWVRLNAQASLSDCSRRITWEFDGNEEEVVGKLNAAIAELTLLRDALKEGFRVKRETEKEWGVKEDEE